MNTTLIRNIKAMQKAIVCNICFIIILKGTICIEIVKGDFFICLKKPSIIGQKIIMHTLTMKKRFTSEYVRKEMMFKAPLLFMVILMNGQTGNGFLQVHR